MQKPVIWLIWHNRLIVIPTFWRQWFTHRRGAVLISRSKDGGIIAGIVARMGGFPVRGSSSRGGATALVELARMIEENYDAYITPDGPRGPCYSVSPGAIWLSQKTGAPIMPVSIEVSSCWRLKSWDRFIIPKPFARVDVTLHSLLPVMKTNGEALPAEQARIREIMLAYTATH